MSRRRIVGYAVWLLLACVLYFFENNTGTRIVLAASVLLPLIPQVRDVLFSRDGALGEGFRPGIGVHTFTCAEETEPGDVRPFRTGDPVNRVHWKLSAKRGELMIREDRRTEDSSYGGGREDSSYDGGTADASYGCGTTNASYDGGVADQDDAQSGETARRGITTDKAERKNIATDKATRKKRLMAGMTALLLILPLTLLIPEIGNGMKALCNRLFDASEAVNTYVYERFPVRDGQSVTAAAAVLILFLSALAGILVLSRSRLMAIGLMAGVVIFQVFFGISFPGWVNVLLFAVFILFMARRPWGRNGRTTAGRLGGRNGVTTAGGPWERNGMIAAAAAMCVISLAVVLFFPGVDAKTEEASERVRDFFSEISGGNAGSIIETPEGEIETRHVHTQSLTDGLQEARTEREFRMVTEEEEQISIPHWVNYLKIILLFLMTVALLIIPFLPFLWMNARRKKAMEARKVFSSENVSEAVCAIFRQVIAWLEAVNKDAGNLPYREWSEHLAECFPAEYANDFEAGALLFEEAAYSDHTLEEKHREQMMELLNTTEKMLLSEADRKERFRLKYRECLWAGEG